MKRKKTVLMFPCVLALVLLVGWVQLVRLDAAAPHGLPQMFISDSTVVEGNSGTHMAVFTITLSEAGTTTAAAAYRTFDGTAQAGSDFVYGLGQIAIPAGQTSQAISITINGDTEIEPDETFTVQLDKPGNVIIVDYLGVGTILNDDNYHIYLPLMQNP